MGVSDLNQFCPLDAILSEKLHPDPSFFLQLQKNIRERTETRYACCSYNYNPITSRVRLRVLRPTM